MKPKIRLNGCKITEKGVTYHCRWETGGKHYCRTLIGEWAPGTTWATMGKAEVALNPDDFSETKKNNRDNS